MALNPNSLQFGGQNADPEIVRENFNKIARYLTAADSTVITLQSESADISSLGANFTIRTFTVFMKSDTDDCDVTIPNPLAFALSVIEKKDTIFFFKGISGGGTKTININSGTVEGETSMTLANDQTICIQSDGTEYKILFDSTVTTSPGTGESTPNILMFLNTETPGGVLADKDAFQTALELEAFNSGVEVLSFDVKASFGGLSILNVSVTGLNKIPDNIFQGNEEILFFIDLSAGIEFIGNNSFESSTLANFYAPIIYSIGESAFANCLDLGKVQLPSYAGLDDTGNIFDGSSVLSDLIVLKESTSSTNIATANSFDLSVLANTTGGLPSDFTEFETFKAIAGNTLGTGTGKPKARFISYVLDSTDEDIQIDLEAATAYSPNWDSGDHIDNPILVFIGLGSANTKTIRQSLVGTTVNGSGADIILAENEVYGLQSDGLEWKILFHNGGTGGTASRFGIEDATTPSDRTVDMESKSLILNNIKTLEAFTDAATPIRMLLIDGANFISRIAANDGVGNAQMSVSSSSGGGYKAFIFASDGTKNVRMTFDAVQGLIQAIGDSLKLQCGVQYQYTPVNSAYTALVNDYTIDCFDTASPGTFTITLPDSTLVVGQVYVIKNSGTGTITIDGGASNIDGSSTQTLTTQYSSITIQASNSSSWAIIGKV